MSFLFDTSFLTGKIAEIEDSSSADGATLVDIDLFDERRRDGENSFHTDTVGDLTNSKGFSGTASGALKHNALEVLDTFFVTFFDYFTILTTAVNASGLFIARSARTLRLSSMLFLCNLPINTE